MEMRGSGMIVVVREGASTEEHAEIRELLANVSSAGDALHAVIWGTETLFCLPDSPVVHVEVERLRDHPAVERVDSIATPYQLASRAFQSEKTTVPVGNLKIGGGEPVIMAGPCSVENETQIM